MRTGLGSSPSTAHCGNAAIRVDKRTPRLGFTASTTAGGTVSVTVRVQDGFAALGSVTLLIFVPGDDTCKAASVFEVTTAVSGDVAAPSAFGPLDPGRYQVVLRYSGDDHNQPALINN